MEEIIQEGNVKRYTAFDNPCHWVTGKGRLPEPGGYEFAAYYDPMPNRDFPRRMDGIYIEITSYAGKDYLLDASAIRPDKSKKYMKKNQRFATFEEAKEAAEKCLVEAERFCKEVGNDKI